MSKKDYELIARVFSRSKPSTAPLLVAWECVVRLMAGELEMMNSRFNRATFYAACGYKEAHDDAS